MFLAVLLVMLAAVSAEEPKEYGGWCLKPNGKDENAGTIRVAASTKNGCLTACLNNQNAKGCEWGDNTCIVHTNQVCSGSDKGSHSCWVLKSNDCPENGIKCQFGPYSINEEFTKSTKVTFVTSKQLEVIKHCRRLRSDTDLSFRVQRDNSASASSIKYWRVDLKKMVTFSFNTGSNPDHTHVTYDGHSLKCVGNKHGQHRCNNLPVGKSVPAVIISVNLEPRNGNAHKQEWQRNKYSINGCKYKHICLDDHVDPAPRLVRCGNHVASSCSACSQGHGSAWCHGQCKWCISNNQCQPMWKRCS